MSIPEAVGLLTIGGVLVALLRWGWPKYKAARRTVTATVATLVGSDEVRHKVTGELIHPAQPGVGVQVAELTKAVTALAEQSSRIEALEDRGQDHEKRIVTLEEARAERVITQIESAQMWRAVANANDDTDPDDAG